MQHLLHSEDDQLVCLAAFPFACFLRLDTGHLAAVQARLDMLTKKFLLAFHDWLSLKVTVCSKGLSCAAVAIIPHCSLHLHNSTQ